ncbi:2174_t:CDS:2 [Entrophospora sp. SA101]|nr:2174_t:CDS:2 [Entrophospora sp. SA101]
MQTLYRCCKLNVICTKPSDPMNVLKVSLALLFYINHFLLKQTKFSFETGSLIDYQQKVISQPVKIDKLDSSVQGFNWRITPDKLLFSQDSIVSWRISRKVFLIYALLIKMVLYLALKALNEEKNITVPLTNSDKLDNPIEAVLSFKLDINNKGEKIEVYSNMRA